MSSDLTPVLAYLKSWGQYDAYDRVVTARDRIDADARIIADLTAERDEAQMEYADSLHERYAIAAERDQLLRWQVEASLVLGQWDAVHEALGSPAQLGESMVFASHREALRVTAERDRLTRVMDAIERKFDDLNEPDELWTKQREDVATGAAIIRSVARAALADPEAPCPRCGGSRSLPEHGYGGNYPCPDCTEKDPR